MMLFDAYLTLSVLPGTNDFSFYVLLFSVVVILLSFALTFFQNRNYTNKKLSAFWSLHEVGEAMDSCEITNLEKLAATAEKTEDKNIRQAFTQIQNDSQRLYQSKWVPEGKHYLSLQKLIPFAKRRSLRPEIVLNIVAIGALAALIIILLPLISKQSVNLAVAALPLLLALLLAAVLYVSNRKNTQVLNDSLADLRMVYTRVLPEYSERSGTALLIDEFMQYDRRMSDSAALLSTKVEELSDQKLVDTVSESIERVLERQIAPALGESNRALSKLCVELSEKQSDGIANLSKEFSASLSETITASLRPLENQVKSYTDEVANSKNVLDMAFAQFDNYRGQAQQLDQQILAHIALLDEQSKRWNDGLAGLHEVSASISANNQEMTKLQGGSEETLAGRLSMMSEAIENFGQMNHETLLHLREENALLNKLLSDTQAESSKVLSEYRHLTQRITISAMDIEKHNGEISENIVKLSNGLDESVKHFTSQLQSGVDVTLSDFDSGLAELTERLSHSATAIRDSVARLVDAVSDGVHE